MFSLRAFFLGVVFDIQSNKSDPLTSKVVDVFLIIPNMHKVIVDLSYTYHASVPN